MKPIETMRQTDLASVRRSGLAATIAEFAERSGARSAALVDRQGTVLAQTGFAPTRRGVDLATLAARMHASGRRIGELAGSGEVVETVTMGDGGRFRVQEMAAGAMLLFSVFEADTDPARVSGALERLRGVLSGQPAGSGPLAALEDPMLQRLDDTFPAE